MATLEEFLALITSEHNQRPRYMETVALSTAPGVDAINLANSLIGLFDLDTAIGEQLDFLGQWVGVTRWITAPLNVWFAFDEPNLGFDQGKWQTPFELANQILRLDDEHYRILLRARIVSNYWDGTIAGAYEAWNLLFAGTGYQILIQDGQRRVASIFGFDGPPYGGFDNSLWYADQPILDIYFSLDRPARLGFDAGYWLGPPGSAQTMPVAHTHGTMHIIQALLGPPLDAVVQALFAGGYLGLKSAGVTVDYMIQWQPPTPPQIEPPSGVGLPLFGFDVGPDAAGYWMSFDDPEAGLDDAPLFYPGAVPPAGSAVWPPTPLAGFDLGAWGRIISAQ
jgi:hypothetical protein